MAATQRNREEAVNTQLAILISRYGVTAGKRFTFTGSTGPMFFSGCAATRCHRGQICRPLRNGGLQAYIALANANHFPGIDVFSRLRGSPARRAQATRSAQPTAQPRMVTISISAEVYRAIAKSSPDPSLRDAEAAIGLSLTIGRSTA